MADGLFWYNDGPNDFIQRMSHAEGEIDDNVGGILGDVVDMAVKSMKDMVMDGGTQYTKTGPRIQSGAMFNAIDGEVSKGRGRVTAYFGYINDPPEWTMYQERGTSSPGRGVTPLLAYAQAQEKAITEMWNQLDQGKWVPQSLRF